MVDRGDLLPGTRVYMMYPELYIPAKIKNGHLPSLDPKIIFKRVYLFQQRSRIADLFSS